MYWAWPVFFYSAQMFGSSISKICYTIGRMTSGVYEHKPWSEKTRQKMKGRVPWNKGLKTGPISNEHKLAISKVLKGRKQPNISKALKGRKIWNKGLTKETSLSMATISKSLKGRKRPECGWNKGLTKETDTRVLKASLAQTKRGFIPWNKGLTKSTDSRILVASKAKEGKPRSAAVRTKVALGVARAWERGVYNKPTSLEHALDLLLQDAGIEYEAQVRFGKYIVDAYVSSHNLVFEADGMFWWNHKDINRERRRDTYLINKGVLAVIHLNDNDLNPWLVT
ncbi:MAG TPA: DUF559 domain-containing protein [bacterium]|nr:DUF559 domain-containing protein [bacterium]